MDIEIGALIGLTLVKVERVGNEEILFHTYDSCYKMYHDQDCCESVEIEDISGDLNDLVGTPITMAESSTNSLNHPNGVIPAFFDDSFTWTFYRLATVKGYVTIRWYGISSGYYSESVYFVKLS